MNYFYVVCLVFSLAELSNMWQYICSLDTLMISDSTNWVICGYLCLLLCQWHSDHAMWSPWSFWMYSKDLQEFGIWHILFSKACSLFIGVFTEDCNLKNVHWKTVAVFYWLLLFDLSWLSLNPSFACLWQAWLLCLRDASWGLGNIFMLIWVWSKIVTSDLLISESSTFFSWNSLAKIFGEENCALGTRSTSLYCPFLIASIWQAIA